MLTVWLPGNHSFQRGITMTNFGHGAPLLTFNQLHLDLKVNYVFHVGTGIDVRVWRQITTLSNV
jgi:hypothetical protein